MFRTVLFEIHHLYYWPNFQPIIEKMIHRKNYKVAVSMPIRNSTIEKNILGNAVAKLSVPFIIAETENERIEKIIKKSFEIIIIGNVGKINMLVNKNTIVVMVYHGIGLKNSYYNDIDDRINLRAIESLDRFNELENKGHKNLILTGFTKLDRLFTITNRQITLLKDSLKINDNKKTILYAPSFYPTSIEKIGLQLPLLSHHFNIIIKLHGFSWEQKRYRYQSEFCTELSQQNENISLVPNDNFDIIPFYKIADILVTDISSTMFEYLPLNRPIIQAECYTLRLKHRIFSRRFWKKMDLKRQEEVDFVYKINNPEDLFSRVYYALDNLDEMEDLRKRATEFYLYKNDGKASDRLLDALDNYN